MVGATQQLYLDESLSVATPLLAPATDTQIRHKMLSSNFYKRHCVYLPAMTGWFICSAALSAYNKIVFGNDQGGFPCPLFLTSIHFLVQWVFSYSISSACSSVFGGEVVKIMTWRTFLGVSIPCGFITAADVGLSNLSLVRISITFFTMIKSSSPIWVLLSAFIFGIEQVSCNLIAVGALIMAGELLTAFGEVEFDTVGFLLCAGAAVCSGIRWTLVQLKVQRLDPPLKSAVVTMRVLAPSMFFFMLLLSFAIEDPVDTLSPQNGDYFSDFNNTMKTISLGLTGATIAIAMVLCEFWLILKANAIVLMIGGVLKEVITILVGVTIFGDQLNAVNISGIIVIFLGVFLYKVTLHLNHKNRDAATGGIESSDAEFAQVQGDDDYDNEPPSPVRSLKRLQKTSDPDLTLRFRIDDEMDEEEEAQSGATATNNTLRGRSSPNSSNGNLEIDGGEEKDLVLV